MTTCTHPIWDCETGMPTGTVARCRDCGIVTIIPPAVAKYKGQTKTIPGMGLPAKIRLEMEIDLIHAYNLADEGKTGARE